MSDVLVMTVEELRFELQRRGKIPTGTNKPDLREALLEAIVDSPTVAQDQYSTAPTVPFHSIPSFFSVLYCLSVFLCSVCSVVWASHTTEQTEHKKTDKQ